MRCNDLSDLLFLLRQRLFSVFFSHEYNRSIVSVCVLCTQEIYFDGENHMPTYELTQTDDDDRSVYRNLAGSLARFDRYRRVTSVQYSVIE